MKYRKKPVVIEAVRWLGNNHAEICEFFGDDLSRWRFAGMKACISRLLKVFFMRALVTTS